MKAWQSLWNQRSAGTGLILVALLACATAHGDGATRPPLEGKEAVQFVQFVQRARNYVQLRSAALEEVPQMVETSSPVEIGAREKLMANAIRAERKSAKRGDVFDGAGKQIQALVLEDWQERPYKERAALWKEIPRLDPPAVNAPYPASVPLATFPPLLLTRLPELPKELEYRFAGPHLILRDVEANMVVDVLPNVLSDPGAPLLGAEAGQ
jgi:hypothetical protein